MRRLSKDGAAVFDALSRAHDEITLEEFVGICSTSMDSLRKLLAKRHPDWSSVGGSSEVEYELNRILADLQKI